VKLFCLALLLSLTACRNPRVGNTIRYPIESDPPTLDTVLIRDHVSFEVVYNLQQGLVRLSNDEEMKILPALAESWEISPDLLTYRFFLREAKWSDGVPVRAQDFVFAWRRLLDPEGTSEYAYFLFDLQQAQEYNSGTQKDFSKVGVRAVDDRTIEIKLRRPAAYFLKIPSSVLTAPQREDIVRAHPTDFIYPPHLPSTGPYKLVKWRHDDKLVFERNPFYWGEPAKIERVELLVISEDSTALNLYDFGELDVAMRIPSLNLSAVQKKPDYRSVPVLRGYYYGFNVNTPPFNDRRVRQAFAMAIHREQLVSILKGGQLPSTSWVPKGMFGYEPDIGLKHNPEKARALLKEAGFGPSRPFPKVTVFYDSSELNKTVAERLEFEWKSTLNLPKTDVATQEWKVYLDTLLRNSPPLWRMGWGADYPDPHNFLEVFHSQSGNNNTGWKNPRFDDLLARAASTADVAARRELYRQAQKLLLEEEAVIVPLFQTTVEMAVKPYLRGFRVDSLENPRFAEGAIESP